MDILIVTSISLICLWIVFKRVKAIKKGQKGCSNGCDGCEKSCSSKKH